jgi:1-aminocyclopropane-1-carboxylate deaminase
MKRKLAAILAADVVRKVFPPSSKILYAHLGGVPVINAYSYIYRNG